MYCVELQTLYNHIVNDIKRINAKHKNNKVNKVQYVSWLFTFPPTSTDY